MIEVVKIFTADLELGMYVSGLDRPWLETPFVLQGFRIATEEDIRTLRRYCQYVYVDIQKSEQQDHVLQRKQRIQRPRLSRQALFPTRRLTS